MTSSYSTLTRGDLRTALENGPFSRRGEGYSIDTEAVALVARDGRVARAWGAAPEQLEDVRAALGEIPGSSVRSEGRVMIASGTHASPIGAHEAACAAFDELAARVGQWGISLVSCGAEPWGERPLVLSTRLRVPFGSPASTPLRWSAAVNLLPISEALFAFSPLKSGASQGVLSYGALERHGMPSPPGFEPSGSTPVETFLDWALEAPCAAAPGRASFRSWSEKGVGRVFPDLADFRTHVERLACRVAPLNGLALRACDPQARPFVSVPLIWWSVLLDDATILREVSSWSPPTRARLEAAAHAGLADPWLASHARRTFALVADRLLSRPGAYASNAMLASFVAFGQRFTLAGRTPADEWMARFARRGSFELADLAELEQHWSRLAGVRSAA